MLKYLVCWMKISTKEENRAGKNGSEEWGELQFKIGGLTMVVEERSQRREGASHVDMGREWEECARQGQEQVQKSSGGSFQKQQER